MKLIAAIDNQWGVGYQNDLLFKLKEDLAFFKRTTIGHNVIMGYRTYLSLPYKNGLPNRINYVLTRSLEGLVDTDQVKFITEIPEDLLRSDAFLIGGAKTYGTYIDYVDEMYLTHVDAQAKHVDAFMPNEVIQKAIKMNETLIATYEENGITFHIKHYY